MKMGFNPTINCNKYQLKVTTQDRNKYLDELIYAAFQGVNRLFWYHLRMKQIEQYIQDIICQKYK